MVYQVEVAFDTEYLVWFFSEKLARFRAITFRMVTRFVSYRILISVIFLYFDLGDISIL